MPARCRPSRVSTHPETSSAATPKLRDKIHFDFMVRDATRNCQGVKHPFAGAVVEGASHGFRAWSLGYTLEKKSGVKPSHSQIPSRFSRGQLLLEIHQLLDLR